MAQGCTDTKGLHLPSHFRDNEQDQITDPTCTLALQNKKAIFHKTGLNIITASTKEGLIRQGWKMVGTSLLMTVNNMKARVLGYFHI